MDQSPVQAKWSLIPLYKILVDGDILFWQIGFDGVRHCEVHSGLNDVISINKIAVDDIIENANTTLGPHLIIPNITTSEQILRYARREYIRQYRIGYQPAGAAIALEIKGMKGYNYTPRSIGSWPVCTQPKINGIRLLCQDTGNTFIGHNSNISMRSWLGKSYTHLTHIENELRDFFPYLPRYCTLDGDLYNHKMDFSTLTSAVKTVKTRHPRLSEVQYWIFDIHYEDPEGTPFEKRCALLINAFRKYICDKSFIGSEMDTSVLPLTFCIVPTQVARNHEEIISQHAKHIANDYEGIMIKKISNGHEPGSKQYDQSLYRPGKHNHILKYKNFTDEEVVIINTNTDSSVFIVRDLRGNIFPLNIKEDLYSQIYTPDTLIGKEITIRYQELSPTLVPQSPIAIAIRDYE